MKKVMAIACVALAVLVATCSAAFTFKADFKMYNRAQFPNGYVTGVVYYHYDQNTLLNSRVRFDTFYRNADGVMATHSDLYHYANGALYSFCAGCDASILGATPDAWYKVNGDQCVDEGQYKRCNRASQGSASNLIEFVVKGTPGQNGFELKYLKFLDGREYELSNLQTINVNSYSEKFQLQDSDHCPTPQCRSFVDVVFVLDASTSVSSTSWNSQIDFLKLATKKFTISENDANVAIIQFSSPYESCCKPTDNECIKYRNSHNGKVKDPSKWQSVVCDDPSLNMHLNSNPKRYLDDCAFDDRCLNQTDATAVVSLALAKSSTTVENAINKLSSTRMYGHTCQRYALVKAYDMLFVNNPRCPPGTNKAECPTPIVIAITMVGISAMHLLSIGQRESGTKIPVVCSLR